MPSQAKVRWAQLRVGVMAMVSMAILAVLIFLFTQDKPVWEHYDTIYTFLDDSASLAKGAPVRLNGILIGSVTHIGLSGSKEANRIVRVTMEVAAFRLKNIPIDSVASIDAENVLGTKFINVTMGKSRVTVEPGGEVKSEASPEIQDLVKKGFGIFDSAQAILGRLDKIVGLIESGQGSIGKFLVDEEFYKRLVKTVEELQKVAETIGSGKGTVGKLLYDESLYNEAHATIGRLDQVIQDLQAGQGTAGQLLKNPDLYKDAQASIAQVRQLLDDIGRARALAISQRTTIFMVFVPANFWGGLPASAALTNLVEKQLTGYNFISLGKVGDQPGQHYWHYLSDWQALPSGTFIPAAKLTPGTHYSVR